jgi:hypothetical protein
MGRCGIERNFVSGFWIDGTDACNGLGAISRKWMTGKDGQPG